MTPVYQLRLLDEGLNVTATREQACEADNLAMELAYRLRSACHLVEVWTGDRLVARVPNTLSPASR